MAPYTIEMLLGNFPLYPLLSSRSCVTMKTDNIIRWPNTIYTPLFNARILYDKPHNYYASKISEKIAENLGGVIEKLFSAQYLTLVLYDRLWIVRDHCSSLNNRFIPLSSSHTVTALTARYRVINRYGLHAKQRHIQRSR